MTDSDLKRLASMIAEEVCRVAASARWIGVKEAARYSNIGQRRLVTLASDGEVVGFKDPDSGRNDWIFDRHSVDAYRKRQAGVDGDDFDLDEIRRRM